VTSNNGWQRRFDGPITVGGRTLRTLRDAADYIVALPEKTSRQEHWQVAIQHLMFAAERGEAEPLSWHRSSKDSRMTT
jgi:hypothetical protein